MPVVSVIIPTYNRSKYVQEAIDSVLAQDYKEFELIVVDDGSTDDTEEVLKAFYLKKIIYVKQENQGESAARNLGVSMSQGKYIAFLDSDDLWSPDKLSLQVPILDANPDIVVVFCQSWQIDSEGQRITQQPLGLHTKAADFTVENLLMYNKIPAGSSTCLIRRSVLEEAGGFSIDIRYGDEWDLWLRISTNGKMFFLNKTLASYRRHKQTQSFFPTIKFVDDILKDHLLLLDRCFSRSINKIPEKLFKKAIAQQYLDSSLASFLLHDENRGRMRLEKVIDLSPDFWKNKIEFSNQIGVFANNYALDRDGNFSPEISLSFVDLLCSNLPEQLNQKDWIHLTQGKVRINVGFREKMSGDIKAARQHILEGIKMAPQLIDPGVMAFLAESILGKRIINMVRSFRHKEDESILW
jgi:glycosyltransferase involved in cell wall biosynthesis